MKKDPPNKRYPSDAVYWQERYELMLAALHIAAKDVNETKKQSKRRLVSTWIGAAETERYNYP